MTRFFLIILACLVPMSISAQTVTVRSGEHGDFTRLALNLPPNSEWVLEPGTGEGKVRLSLDLEGLTFDTSRIFERIGRERVAGVDPLENGKGLNIALACACNAEAFVLNNTMLVIDIRPDGAGATPGRVIVRPRENVVGAEPLNRRASALIRDLSEVRIGPLGGLGPVSDRNQLMPFLPHNTATQAPLGTSETTAKTAPRARDGLGREIAADLAVAATAGLLKPALTPHHNAVPRNKPASNPPTKELDKSQSSDIARQLAAGLVSVDRDSIQGGHISIGVDRCMKGEEIALASWVKNDTDPSRVLAERRGGVFGEFDRVDDAELEEYAKALLYFGFGAEARAILSLGQKKRRPWISLSYLVDGEDDPSGLFIQSSGCDSAASLWSILSMTKTVTDAEVDIKSVIREFEKLPKHLRSNLGPLIAENLVSAGYKEGAGDLLRRMQRMEGHETNSIALGKAYLDMKNGNLKAASQRLLDLSIQGGPESAEAVAAAIDVAEATDTRVSRRIVELSEAYATELRNSDDGEKLWEAYIRSLLLNGGYEAAFSEIQAPHGLSYEVTEAMNRYAINTLVDNADDLTFMEIATRLLADGKLSGDDQLLNKVAKRFLMLDMPDVVLKILGLRPSIDNLPSARVARAEALLQLSRPEEAEIILIGQRGEEVVRLRAEARRQMGDHVFAKTLFEEVGDGERVINSAWLAGDWTDVAESSSLLAPAAGLMSSGVEEFQPDNRKLDSISILSDESAESRNTIRALLNATAIR